MGGLHPGPVPTAQNQAGTVLWDAVYLAANERLRSEAGRKVIVVITDGVDEGSRKTRDQVARSFPEQPEKDVLLFLIENAPLKGWQRDVLSIVRDEAFYFQV